MNDAPPDNGTISSCANCGKGEENSGDLKACAACHMVKYCNRDCQIAHRPLHKKACKKRASELHDEALFKEPPPREECPICFLPIPLDASESIFKSCCGKLICNGCIYAMGEEAFWRGKFESLCAFCRVPATSSDAERIKRIMKLMESGNARAFYNLASYYANGDGGMPQDFAKTNELWLKAGELGCSEAYCNLAFSYANGRGVEMDKKKAKQYWELAAVNGDVYARHNLGSLEVEAGNIDRAMKYFLLAAKAGYKKSLGCVKTGFMQGDVTKDEYANTLRAYQHQHDEMKSDTRDKARYWDARQGNVKR